MRKSKKTALLRLTTIATALKSILSVAALVPITAMGLTLDVQNNKAVVDGEGGDALLFPFYTTANIDNTAITSFSIVNQSVTDTIAVRIRFREQTRGVDAMGFTIVMSPKDEFVFWLAPGENGRPILEWYDNTCIIGQIPGGTSVEFPDPANWGNSFGVTNADLAAGNLEILGLAVLNKACTTTAGVPTMWNGTGCPTGSISLAAAARHNAQGIPANCQVLMDFLSNPDSIRIANENSNGNGISDWTAPTFLPVPNTIVGRYLITIPGQGIESGGNAIAIQNANVTHGSTTPVKYGGGFVGLVTAQSPDFCSDTLNCMSKYAWDKGEYSHPHIGEMVNLANLQRLLSAASVIGHWTNNPAYAVVTDWVVSFPTKYAYMDFNSTSGVWSLLANTKTGLGRPGAWVGANSTDLKLTSVNPHLYGREEQDVTGGIITFTSEINVLTPFSNTSGTPRPSLIQTPARRINAVFSGLNANSGWANLPLTWRGVGDAVTGLIFTARNTDDPGVNNGSIVTLGVKPLIQPYVLQITKAGTGAGLVTSGPPGINCGADCTEAYREGTTVALTTTPTTGFFAGWSGHADCVDGQVVMNVAKTCIATFSALPTDFVVTDIVLNPMPPAPNSTFTATVTVKNQGMGAGDGKFLDMWVNQAVVPACGAVGNKRQAVGNLAVNATKTFTFSGLNAGVAGNKTFRAFVDSGCGTAEGNEANNQFVKSYNVQ